MLVSSAFDTKALGALEAGSTSLCAARTEKSREWQQSAQSQDPSPGAADSQAGLQLSETVDQTGANKTWEKCTLKLSNSIKILL